MMYRKPEEYEALTEELADTQEESQRLYERWLMNGGTLPTAQTHQLMRLVAKTNRLIRALVETSKLPDPPQYYPRPTPRPGKNPFIQ